MINFSPRSVTILLVGVITLATTAVYTTYAYSEIDMRHVRLARTHEQPVRPVATPRTTAFPRTVSPTVENTIVTPVVTPLISVSKQQTNKEYEAVTASVQKITPPTLPVVHTKPRRQTSASNSLTTSSSSLSPSEKSELVSLHNKARADVGVPDLTWSDDLALGAQNWANTLAQEQCTMRHSSEKLGENIFTMWSSSPTFKSKASDAVHWWVNEKKFYNYDQNTCKAGEQCGHYTQVVWDATTEVGCAMTTCTTPNQVKDLWVCRYNPRGNISGQRPY